MTYKKLVFKDNCIDFIRLIAAMIVMFSHSFRLFGVDKQFGDYILQMVQLA